MRTRSASLHRPSHSRLPVIQHAIGLDRENRFVAWLLLLFAALLGGSLYMSGGNVPLTAGIVYLTFVVMLSVFRLDFSLYLFMFTVLLFDQYAVPGFTSFTYDVHFFHNLKEIPYVTYFHSGMFSPFEVHLLAIAIALVFQLGAQKSTAVKPIMVWGAYLFFVAIFLFSFANGLRNGGDPLIALWEVRALFYFCLLYVMVPQILHSKQQITVLIWIIIIAVGIKAIQGVMKFSLLGFTTGGYQVLTNHEDPVFIVTLVVLLIGFLVFNTGGAQKAWLAWSFVILALGFYVGQRRATYASLIVCTLAVPAVLPSAKRMRYIGYLLPVVMVLALYGAAFWNDAGTFGRPVQMIKSGFIEPDKETNFSDYSSNLYRARENYNLAQTVKNNPILGTGFGKKYDQPIPLINIRFTLRDYIPHNQIYWIIVKMGTIGFFAFWFFLNSFAASGTRLMLQLKDPYLKAVTLMIILSVINQMVVSFYDLQLTYYRSMVYLGCLMGLMSVINELHRKAETAAAADDGITDDR